MELEQKLTALAVERYGKTLDQCAAGEVYGALCCLTQDLQRALPAPQGEKKLYYISAEFLMGKLLSCALLALGIHAELRQVLAAAGHDLALVEEYEPEPSLGNGGLGRLAACFLDSIATLGLRGDGVGLNYHYGLFRQSFQNRKQQEGPDGWLTGEDWLEGTNISFTVPFGGFSLKSKLYELRVPGYGNGLANKLRLFDVEHPGPAPAEGIAFDKTDIAKNLTLFLYPDDSDEAGQVLRIYQQYFMVSSAAQLILMELEEGGHPLTELPQRAVVQINDTHPSLIIPELIRLLTQRGVALDQAIDLVCRTCAYTNHTILAEALEKWPLSYLERVCPQVVPIILELDRRVKARCTDLRVAIVDGERRVHMAHMDIHYGMSVNGVAALHTQILKESELKPFYELYPEKFNNKTNGVTFRRWLMACNPELTALIDDCIGGDWRRDAQQLQRLLDFRKDPAVLQRLLDVKGEKKGQLCRALKEHQGVELDPNSVFDIQIKRLHEYKRQQMNALYAIHKYLEIKGGKRPTRPITLIFGAKAAPAYTMAKHIIHLLLCLQDLIGRDPQVSPWLRLVMVENYNVTWAEQLIPACDLSEQISLASKEASGTGNMKFMLNGAVTLGTLDGANVEIAQLVGPEDIYSFGVSSDQVIALYTTRGYDPIYCYHDPEIERLVDFLVSPELLALGDPVALAQLYRDMKHKDWFMALLDTKAYLAAKERALHDYEDRMAWAEKMLVNIAMAGFFSSDRTIAQYNEEIWKLK